MAHPTTPAHQRPLPRRPLRPAAALAALALLAAGCTGVELQNRQPAQEMAREKQATRLPGSVYTGWRVFQDKCASCHGPAGAGIKGGGPDLLPRVQAMGERQFVSLVLRRYDWGFPTSQLGSEQAREALADDVLQRKAGLLTMPAWQGEPLVTAHIGDLYAYLAARADGRQGPERPVR